MSKLTYSVCYFPELDTSVEDRINFTCFDNKVHIRFRDFNKPEVIAGFEKKLCYLLSYLMHYSYLPKTIGKYSIDTLLNDFSNTNDVLEIISTINYYNQLEPISGIKMRRNYKKNVISKPFGELDSDCFSVKYESDIIKVCDLDYFLEKLNISLFDYLFNDKYQIIITNKKQSDINTKFISKENRKLNRLNLSPQDDLITLW